MKQQRIYMVIGTFHPFIGGAETQVLIMSHALQKRGYHTTILTFCHDHTWPSREILSGIPVLRIAALLLGNRERLPVSLQRILYMLALFCMAWTLWRHRHHYDIVHLHQLSVLTLPVALACRLTGKQLFLSVHSAGSGKSDRSSATLLVGSLDPAMPCLQIPGNTWVDGDLEGLRRMGSFFIQFARTLLQRSHATIIILNSRMMDYLAGHDLLLPDLHLIPNGVDTARFHPASATETRLINSPCLPTVICVSKLRYEKGIDVLLHAWHLVQQQQPQSRLILVGNGPIEAQLRGMAEALGIQNSVDFAGLQQDVPAQLRRASLAVLPSRWEGMPNALLEAMACGLPCVATRVGGSEDIVQQDINGLLVENEDYVSLAQALLLLLQDPQRTCSYGIAARTTIEKYYTLDHIINRYIELYQNTGGTMHAYNGVSVTASATVTMARKVID